jgi:hypothetical protein
MQGYKERYSDLLLLAFLALKHSNINTFIAKKNNIKGLIKIQNRLNKFLTKTLRSCIKENQLNLL